jgi:hypothetical protein
LLFPVTFTAAIVGQRLLVNKRARSLLLVYFGSAFLQEPAQNMHSSTQPKKTVNAQVTKNQMRS